MLFRRTRKLTSGRSGGWSPVRKADFVFRTEPARARVPAVLAGGLLIALVVAVAPDSLSPQVRASPQSPHVLESGWRLIEEVRALYASRAEAKAVAAAETTLRTVPAAPPAEDRPIPAGPLPRTSTMAAAQPPATPPEAASTEAAARPATVIREARQMRLTPAGTVPSVEDTARAPRCVEDVAALAKRTMIWFAANSIELNPVQMKHLQKLAQALGKCPAGKLEAVGHADQIGSEAANLAISRRRAEAALESLKASGLDAARVSAVGLGAREPIAEPGNTPFPDPNAINRRVEFVVR